MHVRTRRVVRQTTMMAAVAAAAVGCNDVMQPDAALTPNASHSENARGGTVGPSAFVGPGPAIALTPVARGLTHPVTLAESPDGTGRIFIVDQIGLIRVLMPDGTLLAQPFLDVRPQMVQLDPNYDERGLLGLAFHPGYATNGKFYVFYNRPPRITDWSSTTTVSEFRVSSSDPNAADPASERIVLQEDHPQFNHNAGMIAFGPDGYLYISIGDGGNGNDIGTGHVPDWYAFNEGGNGQDITQNLMGNILRIDVDGGTPYGIPSDNPFVGSAGLDEIYAYGFRNPFRFSFDKGGTHQLFVGDAGQSLWEEADIVVKGGNYGWNVKEGTHCFDAADALNIPASCPNVDPQTGDPLIDPIVEIPNAANPFRPRGIATIIGGYVYRGSEVPALVGQYVYGSYASGSFLPTGTVFSSMPKTGGLWDVQILPIVTNPNGQLDHYLLGFGEDLGGELYVLVTERGDLRGNAGKVLKVTDPAGGGSGGQ